MYCTKSTVEKCFSCLRKQADLMLEKCTNGIDIEIKEHKIKRTEAQNRLLWRIYENIVDFYKETGFFLDNLKIWYLTPEFIHEYAKARFGIKTTTKLSTKEFMDYIDTIQREMIEQSNGFYQPIIVEEKDYFERTGVINNE